MRTRSQKSGLVVLLVLAGLALTAWARHGLYTRQIDTTAHMKEVLILPPGKLLRQIDLGYHTVLADWLYIRANLYYGHHLFSDEQMPWLASFIDILMELDPDFRKIYLWGAMITTHYKLKIDSVPAELIQRAIQILKAGMERFPDDHRFPMRIAFNYYYELGDANSAIPFFTLASQIPDAPEWLGEKLVDLYSKKGKTDLARHLLTDLISQEDNPVLSKALKDRLAFLMDEGEQEEITAYREALISRWQKEFNYLPIDLYLVIRDEYPHDAIPFPARTTP